MAATRSAGVLLYRRRAGLELLLAHMGGPYWASKDERAWTVPKGEFEPDESPLDAARREFAEELGTPAPAVAYVDLGSIRMSGGKQVTVFAGPGEVDVTAIVSNTFDLEWPPRSGRIQSFPEIDRAAWVSPQVARVKLVASQVPFVDRLEAAMAGLDRPAR